MDEEEEDLSSLFGRDHVIPFPQKFTRFSAPDPERGAVMVEWPRRNGLGFEPHQEVRDSWDDSHVKMPFSKVTNQQIKRK